MPLIGLDLPRKEIDGVFDSWDPDGSGEIGLTLALALILTLTLTLPLPLPLPLTLTVTASPNEVRKFDGAAHSIHNTAQPEFTSELLAVITAAAKAAAAAATDSA